MRWMAGGSHDTHCRPDRIEPRNFSVRARNAMPMCLLHADSNAANTYGLDPALVASVIAVESNLTRAVPKKSAPD